MLQVSLLGEQVIGDGSGVVRARSSRTVALIAFLVVHAPAPQTRQRIAAQFWPDSTDEQALTNLRRELHHLRGVLGGDPSLVVTTRDLSWSDTDTCRVDVRAFQRERAAAMAAVSAGDDEEALARAVAALGWYRGELLPGGYDDWLLEARTELEGQAVALCELIQETRTRQGDLAGAVEAARRRIALRPLEEVGYRKLIELQGELGDRAGAVSTFHHCASVLERDLGVEPDPATRETLNGLLTRTTSESPAPPPAVEPGPARSGRAVAELAGRSGELATLRGTWHEAAAGRPALAVVRGDAGVGKTRLVSELADIARMGGAVVAVAQCFGSAGRLALAPVADWLRSPAVRAGMTTVDPVWRAEVDRLVPSGSARTQSVSGARAMVEAWQRHRFFEGLARALIGAGRPTMLVLDNLHWCDAETLDFLAFYLALLPDAPIMVAATVRTDDGGLPPGLGDWTARMRATGMLTELELHPLDVTDTARLAEQIAGRVVTAAEAELLEAATGGFPLYIVEAVRGMVERGADAMPAGDLAGVLRGRLEHVGAATREIAGLAAAVGRNFTLELLTEASDLDADSVVRAVDELWRRRIVREEADGYDFSHDLVRDEAYAQVSPPRRWLLHRRLAQGLELLHADDPDAVSAQLAEQYARGGRIERAVGYYQQAAELAAGRFAHNEAVRLHTEALTLLHRLPEGRARDRQELAVLEAMAAPLGARDGFSAPRLREVLERALTLAEALGSSSSVLAGLVALWTSQFVQGDNVAAHRTARRALAMVSPGSELSAAAHFTFGGSAVALGRPAQGLDHLRQAAQHDGDYMVLVGTRPAVHARVWAAHAHWLLGEDEAARAISDEGVSLARAGGHPFSLAIALSYAAVTHQLRGDLPELADAVDELHGLCQRYGFAYYREWALILQGWAAADAAGMELARRGIDNLTAAGSFARMPYWLTLVADLASRLGQPDTARARLDAAIVAAEKRDDLWWLPEVLRMRAEHDDGHAAVQRLRSAARIAAEHGSIALLRRCEGDLASYGEVTPG